MKRALGSLGDLNIARDRMYAGLKARSPFATFSVPPTQELI